MIYKQKVLEKVTIMFINKAFQNVFDVIYAVFGKILARNPQWTSGKFSKKTEYFFQNKDKFKNKWCKIKGAVMQNI